MRALGWQPRYSIREAVLQTVDYLKAESWVLETR
jgi:nucleoside-diphosphate-sugar epimerase